MGLWLLDVTVIPMKKILALLVTIGAGVGAFLWWKRQQVIAANEVSADPWPAAVVPVQTPTVTVSAESNPAPKKSTPRTKAVKKATQVPE